MMMSKSSRSTASFCSLELFDRLDAVGGLYHHIAEVAQHGGYDLPHVLIVLGNQYDLVAAPQLLLPLGGYDEEAGSVRGRYMVNVVPLPGRLSTSTRPLFWLTIP